MKYGEREADKARASSLEAMASFIPVSARITGGYAEHGWPRATMIEPRP